jgi:hypothetical protein
MENKTDISAENVELRTRVVKLEKDIRSARGTTSAS